MSLLPLHEGWGGPGPWIGLAWLVVLAALATLFLLRRNRWRGSGGHHSGHGSAEAVLAERYARGEITEDQLRRSRAVLKDDAS